MSPPSCAHLRNPNPYTTTLAALILAGILVSYLPQHLKIITRRSSEGLSPWWVLLGGLSSIAAIGNILVLPQSRRDVGCCKVVTGGGVRGCAAGGGADWAAVELFHVYVRVSIRIPVIPYTKLAMYGKVCADNSPA